MRNEKFQEDLSFIGLLNTRWRRDEKRRDEEKRRDDEKRREEMMKRKEKGKEELSLYIT